MSNYSFKIIKNQDDYLHFILHSCKGGVHNNCVVTMDHKEQSATIFWPSGNGINKYVYFTRSQNINRSTLRITNQHILAILKNKLYVKFMEDGFWNQIIEELDTDMANKYCSGDIDRNISHYFRDLDEWYEYIDKLTKTPRFIWYKMGDEIHIKYVDFENNDYIKYSLKNNKIYVEDNIIFIYKGLVVYGKINDNELTFYQQIDHINRIEILDKFYIKLIELQFVPDGFLKSKYKVFLDTRSVKDLEENYEKILIDICDEVLKGIC